MGFMNVQGLNVQIDVIAYREGGFNTTTQKMPGQADFSPIVISHGVAVGNTKTSPGFSSCSLSCRVPAPRPRASDFRGIVDIKILDHPVTTRTRSG